MNVIFRKFRDDGSVIAIFPSVTWNLDPDVCMSYMHVGQHGSCSVRISSRTDLATLAEYDGLLRELYRIGYKDLKAVDRFTRADREARVAGQREYMQEFFNSCVPQSLKGKKSG